MSIAELLEKKQREVLATEVFEKKPRSLKVIPHYLRNEDISVRFPYLVGLAMISNVDGKLTAKKQAKLKKIAMSLEVPEQHLDQVFKAAKEVYSETIDTIVARLTTKQQKVAFLLDSYGLGFQSGVVEDATQGIIDKFSVLLKLTPDEKKKIYNFASDVMNEDSENSLFSIWKPLLGLPVDVLWQFLCGFHKVKNERLKIKHTFWLARICYYQKNYEEAAALSRIALEGGNAACKVLFGYFCEEGIGIRKNSVNAVQWYIAAAKQGCKEAQYRIGHCYHYGKGVKMDEAVAIKWYLKAAKKGYEEAQYKLGNCYISGEGVVASRVEAKKWYNRAAEQGHTEAKRMLKKVSEQEDMKR